MINKLPGDMREGGGGGGGGIAIEKKKNHVSQPCGPRFCIKLEDASPAPSDKSATIVFFLKLIVIRGCLFIIYF